MKLGGVIFILSFWIAGLVAPTYLTLTSGDTIPRAIEKHEKEQNESE